MTVDIGINRSKLRPEKINGSTTRYLNGLAPREDAAPRRDAIDETARPSRAEAESAVRTLIRWAGDDPHREGLRQTPKRVVRAYEEWFQGYREDPERLLSRTFGDTGGYDEAVLLKDIRFQSHCEHHLAPIAGVVHVSYLPRHRVVGISKLVRLVQAYAKRLQIQERLTTEIAGALDRTLEPIGAAVMIIGTHGCMTTRGVNNHSSTMVTSCFLGAYRDRPRAREEFLASIQKGAGYGCVPS